MDTFYYPEHIRHDPAGLHRPENPEKNLYYSEIAQRGLVIRQAVEAAHYGPIRPPADFGVEPIGAVHDHRMISLLQTAYHDVHQDNPDGVLIPTTFRVGQRGGGHKPNTPVGLLGYYSFDIGCPVFKDSWEAAYWSAQTAVSAADHIVNSNDQVAYALCRPPGHHAAADMMGGFCYLNNAAIAANALVDQGHRVAILDVDFHHGNGTQAIFYNRSDVLFCSIHADPLEEYPYFWGYADEFGRGAGEHYNFNFPLPMGTGNAAYLEALKQALARIKLFVPTSVIISFGADIGDCDPVGGFKIDSDGFRQIGAEIRSLGLPTVVVQEGGYLLSTLGGHVVSFLDGINGRN